MKQFFQLSFFLILMPCSAQTEFNGSEIGIEIHAASVSNFGGTFSIGGKYAAILNENFAVGPSFRLQRTWNNNLGVKTNINIYGAGLYAHARYKNALFAGAEFELLRSPYNFIPFSEGSKKWAPTLFLGGGFSKEYNEKVRINLGIFYDVINAENSPFRSSYSIRIKNSEGQIQRILPIIYRINFFFPIGTKKEK